MTKSEMLCQQIELRLHEIEKQCQTLDDRSDWLIDYVQEVRDLKKCASHESIPILLQIVRQGVQRNCSLSTLHQAAIFAGQILVSLAETSPSQELIPALKVLKAGVSKPWAPLEFIPIRLRLQRALAKLHNLPIPASPPQSIQDLPIPIKQEGIE